MNTILRRFIISCGLLSVLAFLFYIVGVVTNERLTHGWLSWNLFLAWIPLGFALLIDHYIVSRPKHPIVLVALGTLWLLFLPNSFYMLTDYIHVTEVARVDPIFDSVMFSVFIILGFTLGIASLFIVHRSLLKLINERRAAVMIGAVIAASSFAIYLGRELRWNSWDVFTDPLKLLGDVYRIIVQPHYNLGAYVTSLTFFIVTAAVYMAVWFTIRPADKKN